MYVCRFDSWEPPVKAAVPFAPATSSHNAVSYDGDGHMVDEAKLLQEAGLEVGVYVKDVRQTNKFGTIEAVGGGRLSIRLLSPSQEEVVTYVEFRNFWTLVYDKAEIMDKGVVTNYQEHLADSSQEISLQRAWGRVQVGLDMASKWVAARKQPLVRIETKPRKKVFSIGPVEPYGLHLLPHSTAYAYNMGDKSKRKFEVDPSWVNSQERVGSNILFIKPCFSVQKFTEPFWAVRRVDQDSADAEAGNMVLVYIKTETSIRIAGGGRSEARAERQSLQTPAITNIKALGEGDELVWAGAFAATAEKRILSAGILTHFRFGVALLMTNHVPQHAKVCIYTYVALACRR